MKYLHQVSLILAITFLAELIKHVLPLPIPASIYGLVLMLILLKTGIIPLKKFRETGEFLLEIMPLMFIPAAVGLLVSFQALKSLYIPIILIIIINTMLVMIVTGHVTQWLIRRERKKQVHE